MDSDSGNEIFLTPTSYCHKSDSSVDTDTIVTGIVNDNANAEWKNYIPNFHIKSDVFSHISEFEGDDECLIMACEQAEQGQNVIQKKHPQQNRFATPMLEEELKTFVDNVVPKNTEQKTKWAVHLFDLWKQNRNSIGTPVAHTGIDDNLLSMSNEELNNALGLFIIEVRNKSGGEYRPNTLYELVTSIQHYLRTNGRFVNILDDNEFSLLRQRLDAKMKELSRKGIGLQSKKADIISVVQEELMGNKGVLGSGNPQKLLDTVLFNLGLNFALRAGQEHRNLRFGDLSQINLKVSQDDRKRYLEYSEDTSKTYSGGIHHRKVVPKMTRAYENGDQPDRFVVRLYEKYCSFRPKDGRSPALYLRPKKYPTDTQWYDDVPVGIHSLQGTVARLCKEAGFVGRYTNHSLRATAATRLFVAGVDEQLIAEKTGHRSTAIRGYKRTSEAQQREVSDIVQKKVKAGNSIATATTDSATAGTSEINIQAKGISLNLKF